MDLLFLRWEVFPDFLNFSFTFFLIFCCRLIKAHRPNLYSFWSEKVFKILNFWVIFVEVIKWLSSVPILKKIVLEKKRTTQSSMKITFQISEAKKMIAMKTRKLMKKWMGFTTKKRRNRALSKTRINKSRSSSQRKWWSRFKKCLKERREKLLVSAPTKNASKFSRIVCLIKRTSRTAWRFISSIG